MPKKLALNDDEILLGYLIDREGGDIGPDKIIRLYSAALPCLKAHGESMFENVRQSCWTRGDYERELNQMPLERRLETLVPCAFICARNITDAYLRGGRALAALGIFFKSRERDALKQAVNRQCLEISGEAVAVRKPKPAVAKLLICAGTDRDRLVRRAAAARARTALGGGRLRRIEAAATYDEQSDADIERAARQMFPDGLAYPYAIAVRLVLKRFPRVERDRAVGAILRACVRK